MTREQAATVRAMWDALARGDIDGALATCAPDVRWHGAGMQNESSACRGREQMRRFLTTAHDEGRSAELLELRDAGERFVAIVRTDRAGEESASGPHGEVFALRDGQISSIVVYPDVAGALAATGTRPRRPQWYSGQLGDPRGRFGRLVTAVLNIVNRDLNRGAIDALGLRPGELVLDVGFGGGVGSVMALEAEARVIAIDPSEDLVAGAERRLGARADARVGSAARPGVEPGSIDAALAVNSIYFWGDVGEGLAGIRTALAAGGRVVIGVERATLRRRAREVADLPASPEGIAEQLEAAGFSDVVVRDVGRRAAVVLGSV